MFGVRMRNTREMVLNSLLESELVESFVEKRYESRRVAKEQIAAAQKANKTQFDKKRKPEKIYDIGDLVAIKRTQFVTGRKLNNDFMGPYEVTKCKRHGRYEVRKIGDFDGPQNTSTSCDNMKPWTQLNWDTDLSGSDMESDGRM